MGRILAVGLNSSRHSSLPPPHSKNLICCSFPLVCNSGMSVSFPKMSALPPLQRTPYICVVFCPAFCLILLYKTPVGLRTGSTVMNSLVSF